MTGNFARRAAAPADRKVATGWIRSLDGSQAASRRHTGTGGIVALVLPSLTARGLFDGLVELPAYTIHFRAKTRDEAKTWADGSLRTEGWRLADVVGGTVIEEG
jgi:hypothetical protein